MKTKTITLEDRTCWELPDNVITLTEHLNSILEQVPSEYRDTVEIEYNVGYTCGTEYPNYEIFYTRPYTEEELVEEELNKKSEQEKLLKKKLMQYNQLKEELGID